MSRENTEKIKKKQRKNLKQRKTKGMYFLTELKMHKNNRASIMFFGANCQVRCNLVVIKLSYKGKMCTPTDCV